MWGVETPPTLASVNSDEHKKSLQGLSCTEMGDTVADCNSRMI